MKKLNSFHLKLIAVITMIIDHTAAVFVAYGTTEWMVMRSIGRLAFPLYCFLLVQGFVHTKNIKIYLTRLGLFALISEIPFDLGLRGRWFYWDSQNVFATLFLGLLCLYIGSIARRKLSALSGNIVAYLVIFMGCFIAYYLNFDYGYLGIITIVIFHEWYQSFPAQCVGIIAAHYLLGGGIQTYAAAALIPIGLYNGNKGYSKRWIQYLFYAIYPVHLMIIGLVRMYF